MSTIHIKGRILQIIRENTTGRLDGGIWDYDIAKQILKEYELNGGSSTLIWTEKLRSRTLDLKQMRSSKYVKTRTPHIHDRVQKANGAAVPKWENETSNY